MTQIMCIYIYIYTAAGGICLVLVFCRGDLHGIQAKDTTMHLPPSITYPAAAPATAPVPLRGAGAGAPGTLAMMSVQLLVWQQMNQAKGCQGGGVGEHIGPGHLRVRGVDLRWRG